MASSSGTISPQISKRFYGWFALTGAALGAFVGYGIFFYSYGVFLPIMVDEFGWSRAIVGLGMSLGALAFGLPSPLIGILVTKFGAKANLVIGNLIGAIGLASMFLAHEVWQVYLFYIIAGLGCCMGGVLPATTVANSWFTKKRSLAVGIIMACGGLGGFVFPLLATALLTSIGWRMAWVVLASILFLVGSIIGSLILVKNKPEDIGQVPDGVTSIQPQFTNITKSSSEKEQEVKWTIKKVLRHPTIWLIITFGAANGFVGGTIMGHQVAYLRDIGYSPIIAASTLSVIAGCGIFGSLGSGFMAMRINIRHLIVICFAMRLISLVILLITQNIIFIYLYSILFGISTGMLMTAMFTIVVTYYGKSNFARIQGVVFAFIVVFQAAGPVVAGAIYDGAGNYVLAFIIATVATLFGTICAFLAKPPTPLKATTDGKTV